MVMDREISKGNAFMYSKANNDPEAVSNVPASNIATSSISTAVIEAEERGNTLIEDYLNSRSHTRLLTAKEFVKYTENDQEWLSEGLNNQEIMSVEYKGECYYPAFQINPDNREIRAWVSKMIEILDELDLDVRDFAIWTTIPSGRFEGDAPIEHVGDDDFLPNAAASLAPM